jgi:hypothetical protein
MKSLQKYVHSSQYILYLANIPTTQCTSVTKLNGMEHEKYQLRVPLARENMCLVIEYMWYFETSKKSNQ